MPLNFAFPSQNPFGSVKRKERAKVRLWFSPFMTGGKVPLLTTTVKQNKLSYLISIYSLRRILFTILASLSDSKL